MLCKHPQLIGQQIVSNQKLLGTVKINKTISEESCQSLQVFICYYMAEILIYLLLFFELFFFFLYFNNILVFSHTTY
jgi:hypothetical protein